MADTSSIDRSIRQLDERIQSHLDKANRARNVSIILGIVIIVIMIGYFSWASTQVRKVSQPQDIAQVAGGFIVDKFDASKPELEKSVTEMAPKMVNTVIDDLVKSRLPEGRKAIQDTVIKEADKQIAAVQETILDELDKIMENHGENIRALAQNLDTNEGREAFQEEVYKQLNEIIADEEIKTQVDTYGIALQDIDGMLARVMDPSKHESRMDEVTHELLVVIREMANRAKLEHGDLPVFPGIDSLKGATLDDLKPDSGTEAEIGTATQKKLDDGTVKRAQE